MRSRSVNACIVKISGSATVCTPSMYLQRKRVQSLMVAMVSVMAAVMHVVPMMSAVLR